MKLRNLLASLCVASVALGQTGERPYEGHKQIRVPAATRAVVEALDTLEADIWTHRIVPMRPIDLRLSPEQYASVLELGLAHVVVADDLQAVVDAEQARIAARAARDDIGWYDEYRTLDEYWVRWQSIVDANPGIASIDVAGRSIEGRDIPVIVLNGDGRTDKPVFVINACQHAREWLSPAATTFTIESLVNGYGSDPRITRLLDDMEWVFLPMVNPDGFDFSWTDERFWRKNKRMIDDRLRGVDLNRNWDINWGGPGSSSSPGSQTFHGDGPFSEPELQVFLSAIDSVGDRIVGHLDVHTHSQLVLSPWGYTRDAPADLAELNEVGEAFADGVLDATGAIYEVGQTATVLYLVSGGGSDWFYDEFGALSWTIELRPEGPITLPGFDPPPDQILPAGEELLEGTLRLAEEFTRHPADLDRDDRLTLFDYLRFQALWAERDPRADIDENGEFDAADLAAFDALFGS